MQHPTKPRAVRVRALVFATLCAFGVAAQADEAAPARAWLTTSDHSIALQEQPVNANAPKA